MANEDIRLKRREANSAYLRMRTEHQSKLAPVYIEIDPDDFADPVLRLLKGPNLKNGLRVFIPKWILPPPEAPEKVEVVFNNGEGRFDVVADHVFEIPAGGTDFPETFPYEMRIEANYLPQNAQCQVGFIQYPYNDSPPNESQITPIYCDQEPPYKHAPPAALTFDSPYFDDVNLPPNSTLTATIPAYDDWQATDKIAVYLVDAAHIPDDTAGLTPIFYGDVPPVTPGNTGSEIEIDGDEVRKLGDAECVFIYVLIDKATNPSHLSLWQKISLTFGPPPSNLKDPEVPQADSGPLVVEHAMAGVSVWIPQYDNHKSYDFIRVKWGNTTLEDVPVGPNPLPKILVPVEPKSLMLLEYGENTTGDKETNISYHVVRKGRLFGPKDIDIDVNFEVPIPWIPWPDPGWPDTEHPDLEEGVVTNWDDSRTNELTRADKDKDANFTFTWYDQAVNGHIIDFFWNGTRVVEAQIIFDDSNPEHVPGRSQTVEIPWSYIKGGGNGSVVPVYYRLRVTGLENDLTSTKTEVDVNAIAVELPPASFPTIDPVTNPWPGCKALEDDGALRVDIPDLTGVLKDGDEINFVFTPMRGSDLNAPEDPIDNAEFEKDYVLGDAGTPLTGFTIRVEPYTTHILPLFNENPSRRGRVKVQYSHHDGLELLESTPLTVRTAFHGLNEPCEIPRVPGP
ncbi:hypothetical protein [Pseudomonas sp. RGM2987]|uniref:hypothetical protein n=1 Tax=Pseudomonas sp. RGM2987 TaxID=2930090 RepID=UPI001FD67590|nr:hypothetical protein [Pseudomonas sp. RGM2987]MCJ8205287.1 hypothetical protein [Pseudomonas sp. RGM2987]